MPETELGQPVELTLERIEDRPAKPPEVLPTEAIKAWVLHLLNKHWLAIGVIGVPVFVTVIYEALFASDIYVSEAHFIVQSKAMSSSGSLNGLSATSSLSPLSSMSQSNDYTQAVNDYLASRDLLNTLIEKDGLLLVLSRPEADFWARYPSFLGRRTVEALYRRFDDFVYPYFDDSTGISTLYVYAFRPEDAHRIAVAALEHAESLVNRLNERQQKDSIAFAQDMVDKAEAKVKEAQQRITDFRTDEKLFDPIRQGASMIELISKMNGDIAQLRAELNEVNVSSPGSPKIASIKARIAAIEQQIAEQRELIAGGNQSLAPKLALYEKLVLERDLGGKIFSSTLASLESAIKDMDLQRLYLQRVVVPNLPDYALYPRRGRVILIVLGFSLCIFWILRVVGEVILEHDA